jgi:hypothetical protein
MPKVSLAWPDANGYLDGERSTMIPGIIIGVARTRILRRPQNGYRLLLALLLFPLPCRLVLTSLNTR